MQRMKPTFSGPAADWIERRAKLFEAGEYPDKGVTVTHSDLSLLASSFASAVPIWIEHAASPLELGYLTAVAADGNDLYGTLAFSPEAHALIERSGARSLSVGLAPDLSAIREVSLVRQPRVASAQIFSGDSLQFDREFSATPDYQAAYERLQQARQREQSDENLRRWVQEGRLTPAQVPFARALAAASDTLEFDGRSVPVSHLLAELIRHAPSFRRGTPIASTPESDDALMLPEEAAFYRQHFPDVTLREIAARR